MMRDDTAIKYAKLLIRFCQEQGGCQNCIFHENRCDHWDCYIRGIDLEYRMDEIEARAKAKKRTGGYL